MKGDFSRLTFDADRRFRRVLLQQGRVMLDADWNEQAAILLHYVQTLARHIIGPHGGPARGMGFKIAQPASGDFTIDPGPYYVNGILCEAPKGLKYKSQADFPEPQDLPGAPFLVYLDVWEHHLTYLEDVDLVEGSIREVALGGPDTATRTRVVAQVRCSPSINRPEAVPARTDDVAKLQEKADLLLTDLRPLDVAGNGRNLGQLRARALTRHPSTDPCNVSPDARFRGSDNQLYRVEIHTSGGVVTGGVGTAGFKWSRENGSVVFPVAEVGGPSAGSPLRALKVKHLGRDERLGLHEGALVELVDDDLALRVAAGLHAPSDLLRIERIDRDTLTVWVSGNPPSTSQDRHPLLRRWDGAGQISAEGHTLNAGWITLERGVQIQFAPPGAAKATDYRAGDYWTIAARTATGDVEWPRRKDGAGNPILDADGNPEPRFVGPHGIEHAYAPLAFVLSAADPIDLRQDFPAAAEVV